jgi:hypothetical protein
VPADFYVLGAVAPPFGRKDARLMRRCHDGLTTRRQSAGTILVTSETRDAVSLGTVGGVLHEGKLRLFGDVREAAEEFERITLAADDSIVSRARAMIARGWINEARHLLQSDELKTALPLASKEELAELFSRAGDSSSTTAPSTPAA